MAEKPTGRSVEILLIEDNPGDIRLTQEAFKESRLQVTLRVATDGIEALAFLGREGKYAEARLPDLILLDLNLPKMDGREVLARIKCSPDLKCIPVVVLTTSSADSDIQHAYRLHANCYVTKPVDFTRFLQVIRSIEDFWLSVVRLPVEDSP